MRGNIVMRLFNTENHYGNVAIVLHWLMAIIIIGLLALGLYMMPLPISPQKLRFYRWHKEFGVLILGLVMVRFMWRLATITPLLPSYLPTWQKIAARSVHFSFYIFMFLLPISGWLMSSAAGFSVSFFGLFLLPDFISPDENLRIAFTAIHKYLSYLLIAAIIMHVGATVQHYVIYKDNLLRRMWP